MTTKHTVKVAGHRARTTSSRRGAERVLGQLLTTEGQVGYVYDAADTLVLIGKGTSLGWIAHGTGTAPHAR